MEDNQVIHFIIHYQIHRNVLNKFGEQEVKRKSLEAYINKVHRIPDEILKIVIKDMERIGIIQISNATHVKILRPKKDPFNNMSLLYKQANLWGLGKKKNNTSTK